MRQDEGLILTFSFESCSSSIACYIQEVSSESSEKMKDMDDVNNCAHSLVVLVLCVFGTCRAFLVPIEVFLTWCPQADFSCAPVFVCLKGP